MNLFELGNSASAVTIDVTKITKITKRYNTYTFTDGKMWWKMNIPKRSIGEGFRRHLDKLLKKQTGK